MFSLMALIGDPIYQYFSKGLRGQSRLGPEGEGVHINESSKPHRLALQLREVDVPDPGAPKRLSVWGLVEWTSKVGDVLASTAPLPSKRAHKATGHVTTQQEFEWLFPTQPPSSSTSQYMRRSGHLGRTGVFRVRLIPRESW